MTWLCLGRKDRGELLASAALWTNRLFSPLQNNLPHPPLLPDRFKDLVSLLQQHYNTLPADSGWLDVYYWLDIFAVNQNFTGSFTANPDSDFMGERKPRG